MGTRTNVNASNYFKIKWLEVHRKHHHQRDGKVDRWKTITAWEIWTFYQLFFKPYCQLSKGSFLIMSRMISNVFHDSWDKDWFLSLASVLLALHTGRGLTITNGMMSFNQEWPKIRLYAWIRFTNLCLWWLVIPVK